MLANRVLTAPGGPYAVPGAGISDEQIRQAMTEPVVLAEQAGAKWKAPHFVWQVRHQLGEILCGAEQADSCELVDSGGYRIVTTLDWKMQQIAEKWVKAAAIAPNAPNYGGGYTPTDSDNAERGPLRMREAIQLSLNIPAIKAAIELTPGHVYDEARKFGITFVQRKQDAGPAIAIGTLNLHYADLISAFGAIANGGKLMPRTAIVTVTDAAGKAVYPIPRAAKAAGKQGASPTAAHSM